MFLSVSMGLSLHNSLAVIEGYLGIKTPFVRTPKSGEGVGAENREIGSKALEYITAQITWLTWLELLLALVFAAAAIYGLTHAEFGLLPFHLMLSAGFAIVGLSAFAHIPRYVRKSAA